jgi:hypothetical protein
VITPFNVQHAQYADGIQMFIALDANNTALSALKDCFSSVRSWLGWNGLVLNQAKSEAIVLETGARQRRESSADAINVAGALIPVSNSVKNLGVTTDCILPFQNCVDNIYKAASYQEQMLRRIRKCPSFDEMKSAAVALVSRRIDYCNCELYDTRISNITRLKQLQNTVAHFVTRTQHFQHIMPTFAQLHWLAVRAHIEFKVAFLTVKTLTSWQPSYLLELLHFNTPIRQLCSNNHCRLTKACIKTRFTNYAFCHAGLAVWNNLPAYITNSLTTSAIDFKHLLKTHLFTCFFQLQPSDCFRVCNPQCMVTDIWCIKFHLIMMIITIVTILPKELGTYSLQEQLIMGKY